MYLKISNALYNAAKKLRKNIDLHWQHLGFCFAFFFFFIVIFMLALWFSEVGEVFVLVHRIPLNMENSTY